MSTSPLLLLERRVRENELRLAEQDQRLARLERDLAALLEAAGSPPVPVEDVPPAVLPPTAPLVMAAPEARHLPPPMPGARAPEPTETLDLPEPQVIAEPVEAAPAEVEVAQEVIAEPEPQVTQDEELEEAPAAETQTEVEAEPEPEPEVVREPADEAPMEPEAPQVFAPEAVVEPQAEAAPVAEPERVAPAARIHEPKPKVVFLEQHEVQRPVQPRSTLEQQVGTTWLLRVGGVLLTLGLAWGAMELESHLSPVLRVALGYLLCVVLTGAAMFVDRRNAMVGGLGLVVAWSAGYLVSFAAAYIERTKVGGAMQPWASWVAMVGFAGAIALLGERRRSEAMAGFGFLLAMVGAYISASASQGFAAASLLLVSVTAGLFLVRNEWVRITALALVGTWGGLIAMYALTHRMPGGGLPPEILVVGAVLQYTLYVAAYMRWGRVWLARERAAELSPEQDATPEVNTGLLPWSRSFDLINSLGFIGLVLTVGWFSSLQPNFAVLLAVLAMISALRAIVQPIRHSGTEPFHFVCAVGLMGAWGLHAFAGMNAAVVLGLQTVMLVAAGSSARPLRWVRPLSAVPASLAVGAMIDALARPAVAAAPSLALLLVPGVLLMVSTLPFELWLAGRKWSSQHPLLEKAGLASGLYRSLLAAGLLLLGLFRHMSTVPGFEPQDFILIVLALGVGTVAGIRLLSARAWYAAGLVYTGVGLLGMMLPSTGLGLVMAPLATLVLGRMWLAVGRHTGRQWLSFLLHLLAGTCLLVGVLHHVASSVGAVYTEALLLPLLGYLITMPVGTEPMRRLVLGTGDRAPAVVVSSLWLGVTLWIAQPPLALFLGALMAMAALEVVLSRAKAGGAAAGTMALLATLQLAATAFTHNPATAPELALRLWGLWLLLRLWDLAGDALGATPRSSALRQSGFFAAGLAVILTTLTGELGVGKVLEWEHLAVLGVASLLATHGVFDRVRGTVGATLPDPWRMLEAGAAMGYAVAALLVWNGGVDHMLVPILGLVIALGVASLEGRIAPAWRLPLAVACGLAIIFLAAHAVEVPGRVSLVAVVLGAVLASTLAHTSEPVWKRRRSDAVLLGVFLAVAFIAIVGLAYIRPGTDWGAHLLLGMAALLVGCHAALEAARRKPMEELRTSPLTFAALGICAVSLGVSLLLDAPRNLWSPLSLAAPVCAYWLGQAVRGPRNERESSASLAALVVGVLLVCLGWMIHHNLGGATMWLPLLVLVPLTLAALTGVRLRALLVLAVALGPVVLLHALLCHRSDAGWLDAVLLVAGAGALLAASRTVQRNAPPSMEPAAIRLGVIVSIGLAVASVLNGCYAMLQGSLVTAAWGVVAATLLVLGFLAREREWRWTGIGIFALATVRLMLFDLRDANAAGRIVAAIVIGLLLIGSSYGYAILSRKYADEQGGPDGEGQ